MPTSHNSCVLPTVTHSLPSAGGNFQHLLTHHARCSPGRCAARSSVWHYVIHTNSRSRDNARTSGTARGAVAKSFVRCTLPPPCPRWLTQRPNDGASSSLYQDQVCSIQLRFSFQTIISHRLLPLGTNLQALIDDQNTPALPNAHIVPVFSN